MKIASLLSCWKDNQQAVTVYRLASDIIDVVVRHTNCVTTWLSHISLLHFSSFQSVIDDKACCCSSLDNCLSHSDTFTYVAIMTISSLHWRVCCQRRIATAILPTTSNHCEEIVISLHCIHYIYTVNHKKRWQYICDHNFRKSRSIFIIFALI